MFQEVLRVRDKSQPKKMCLYGIIEHGIKVHCFKGREATKSQEGRSDCQNARSKEPSQYPSLQWFNTILLMFCEFFCLPYGTNHKTNVEVKGVHLDLKVPRCMGNHQVEIYIGSNFNCLKLGEGIPFTYGFI